VETSTHSVPLWKDYLLLTKPRVISLLLFTTWTAMVMAERGWPGWWLFLFTGLGFYGSAGAAHVINMIIDRDIDLAMKRTSERAVASGRIPVSHAAAFALALGVGSFAMLWWGATPLAAWMALSGLVFYVVIYTLLLKRRTWSNIVIGGAAGAFPPLVGWAAVTDTLPLLAWILFAIIFLWTPVHFWALAILIKDDYAEVGVPMLPVVRGERATAVQICWYTVLTVAISVSPLLLRESTSAGTSSVVSWFYVGVAAVLNCILALRSWQLLREPVRARASSLFHYSMLYLALLFWLWP
jgi:protoheme IX farnesyltransferase